MCLKLLTYLIFKQLLLFSVRCEHQKQTADQMKWRVNRWQLFSNNRRPLVHYLELGQHSRATQAKEEIADRRPLSSAGSLFN